jgi:hypothetical protein
MTAPTVVADDWTFDPLEPTGSAELYRRLEAAAPRRVRRADLEGHVGLTARELYELGCTPMPLDLARMKGAILWRAVIVAGAVVAGLFLTVAVLMAAEAAGVSSPDDERFDLWRYVGGILLTGLAGVGGLRLVGWGVRRLRWLTAIRRRASPHAARRPSDDPHGRATVATLRGPGVLRVQLLWLRGDARDPRYAEVRTLAERQVADDDAARAEDAVAAMSEIALRADSAHELRHQNGLPALGLRRRPRRAGDRLRPAATPSRAKIERLVDADWRPEPLTDDGQAELARRLVTAKVERWSASVLAPLLVTSAADAPREAPPLPDSRKAKPVRNDFLAMRRYWFWGALLAAAFALAGEGQLAVRLPIAVVALAVAAAAALAPHLSAERRRGAQLTRAVRRAAAALPRALEQGVPGPAGLFAVARAGGGISLLHVRPALVDGRRGELEVRRLATRTTADDDLDAVSTFCAIASDAQLRQRDVGRSAQLLRSLVARLGRVPSRTGEPGLLREPLAWVAVLPNLGVVILAVKHTVAGTWHHEAGVYGRSLGFAALLFVSFLLLRAARRIRDPFAL